MQMLSVLFKVVLPEPESTLAFNVNAAAVAVKSPLSVVMAAFISILFPAVKLNAPPFPFGLFAIRGDETVMLLSACNETLVPLFRDGKIPVVAGVTPIMLGFEKEIP